MRLVKSKGNGKYILTFEIEPHEAAMVRLYAIWESKKLVDFVDALSRMTKPAEDPLMAAFRRRKEELAGQSIQHNLQGSTASYGPNARALALSIAGKRWRIYCVDNSSAP
jgi:hypothetical protein